MMIKKLAIDTFSCPVGGHGGSIECPENSIIVGAGCDVNPLIDNIEIAVQPIITSRNIYV